MPMSIPKLAIAFVCVLIISGCAGSQATRPDWVAANSSKYASAHYLVGRGTAATQEDAQNRARAEVAKVFEVAIDVDSEDTQSYHSVSTADQTESRGESKVTRTISTHTKQIVQGIQIVEVWQDPDTKTHHALAVLPRLQAANGLRQEIERLDAATRSYILQARDQTDLFARIGAAQRALDRQLDRLGYQKSLRIVDVSGRGTEAEWSTGKLRADLDALLKRVRIAPTAAAEAAPELATMLAGAVAAAGFLVEPGQVADYTLEAALPLEDRGLRDGWYWTQGALEIKLYDRHDGRMRGTYRWEIKGAGQQPGLARQRALEQVDAILKKELRATLIAFASA